MHGVSHQWALIEAFLRTLIGKENPVMQRQFCRLTQEKKGPSLQIKTDDGGAPWRHETDAFLSIYTRAIRRLMSSLFRLHLIRLWWVCDDKLFGLIRIHSPVKGRTNSPVVQDSVPSKYIPLSPSPFPPSCLKCFCLYYHAHPLMERVCLLIKIHLRCVTACWHKAVGLWCWLLICTITALNQLFHIK